MNNQLSIHYRLLRGLVIPLAIIAVLVSIETFYSAKKTAIRLHDQILYSVMLVIAENVISSQGDLLSENILEALTENLGDQYFYHAVGPDNAFVTGYSGVPDFEGVIDNKPNQPFYYDSVYKGDPVRVVTISQFISEQELNGWMRITAWQRISERENLTFEIFNQSVLRLLVMILCAGVIVWIAVTQGLKPLEKLKRSIEKRSADDLSPIKGVVPVEVKDLVVSMNKLFNQLSRANRLRERFLGDAAHQLRNPIAALKTQSEAALDNQSIGEYQTSIEKIVHISRSTGKLIDQMLVSARAHAQDPEQAEIFTLADVVRQAAEDNAYQAMQKNHEYTLNISDESLQAKGYPALLKEALANLIDNAICHNQPGSHIEIEQSPASDRKTARLCVSDNGRKIGQDEFIHLLEPFATGNDAHDGTGLGLSVVNDIAKLHGGRLQLINASNNSSGKSLVISLPLTRRQD
ncbi:MAG: sensor histidine kinase [Gammaproteobacteria bacterium]|nr:sensor histidine kinase [Gammaproteobacteria bacterium]